MRVRWRHPVSLAVIASMVLLVLWLVFSGGSDEQGQSDGPKKEAATQTIRLKIKTMKAEPHRRSVVLYGATEASRDVDLQAQTQGAVIEIPAKEGDLLKKGDVILRIDERDRRAQLARARAVLQQRDIEYQAARRLQIEGFQTEIRLAESKSQLEEARASLRQIELDLAFTQLTAPFEGVLERVNVEVGDFVGVGVFGVEGALARIIDHDPLVITGQVAEKDRTHMEKGVTARGKLADGRKLTGILSYLGTAADAKSRTFRVEVEIPNPNGEIPAGVTAEIAIPTQEEPAYFISSSALSLDDKGQVGIKRLDDENRVVFQVVEIIEDTKGGMWVTGLPEQIRLIASGQAYVSHAQVIDPAMIAQE